jgi:hypothetical protein
MDALAQRISAALNVAVDPAVAEFAAALGESAGARAVLFYGSNLRTRSLEGVLDFYVLLPGEERAKIWPTVSYHERQHGRSGGEQTLRAKVATMTLSAFAKAASGQLADTTIWARFVQPAALVWQADGAARADVTAAIGAAAMTAAKLAAALGPASGTSLEYWRALFRATYKAEFRVEKPGRENDILDMNADHFEGLLLLALDAAGIACNSHAGSQAERISPSMAAQQRNAIIRWWRRRQRLGKPLNVARLLKASMTFEGAARYAAWKIERHTGMPVEVTPFRERFPLLAAPGVLWSLRNHRKHRRHHGHNGHTGPGD